MTRTRLLVAATGLLAALNPLGAQSTTDSAGVSQRTLDIQYLRPQDQRGINMFETPKVAGAAYNGFKVQWGAAFAQQFQGLTHKNTADSVFQGATAAVPGNAGAAAVANRNRLQRIGNGFNNAVANAYMHAQLAKGIRIQLTSYLSARHHNETWVKDGFIQIDDTPIDLPILNSIMKYTTIKIGHFEVNYGDFHFKRSDNGQVLYNPLVGNAIMDAFTTEVGAEAIFQKSGFLAVAALTNGEVRGQILRASDRSPAFMGKLGFDKQLNADVRTRLTASYRNQGSAANNTLYSGDRAGSRYYYVLENYVSTEAANFTSGNINPAFTDKGNSVMVNPFLKVKGAEFFGMYEVAKGRAAPNTNPTREVKQYMAEGTYRFLKGDKLFLAARWNQVTGDLGGLNNNITVTRANAGGGWFILPTLLLKGELVTQKYEGFARTDIRNGGQFRGFMLEAATSF
ncbi:hypothetical protein [Gemmatimonas phototrophica]|uniref:hypothetical protein n=1 Tax=Gemmatimonas phototrophica TaxID=1379270 RepID=UPI0006A6BF42|nr:hypothetical protein [Gemmatimonas phototrophica]